MCFSILYPVYKLVKNFYKVFIFFTFLLCFLCEKRGKVQENAWVYKAAERGKYKARNESVEILSGKEDGSIENSIETTV